MELPHLSGKQSAICLLWCCAPVSPLIAGMSALGLLGRQVLREGRLRMLSNELRWNGRGGVDGLGVRQKTDSHGVTPNSRCPFSETGNPCTAMKRLHMGTAKHCGSGQHAEKILRGAERGPWRLPLTLNYTHR